MPQTNIAKCNEAIVRQMNVCLLTFRVSIYRRVVTATLAWAFILVL